MSRGNRRQGREFALKVLYGLPEGVRETVPFLEDFWKEFRFREDELGEPLEESGAPISHDVRQFTEALAEGVLENLERIDSVIREASLNWSLERMAKVDLSILRLATYELLWMSETPSSVVINEAIEIGKLFGTGESASFLHGILDRIAKSRKEAGT